VQPRRDPVGPAGDTGSPSDAFSGEDETQTILRAKDWAATPLGPVEEWSDELRSVLAIVMRAHVPMLLWWGPSLVQLYNDAARDCLGSKHPGAIAQPAPACFADVAPDLRALADGVLAGDGVMFLEDVFVPVDRDGAIAGTYWTFWGGPVEEGDVVGGVLVAALETTEQVLDQRRMAIIRKLSGLSGAGSDDVAQACQMAFDALQSGRADVPLGGAWLVDDERQTLHLIATFGVALETVQEWVALSGPDETVTLWRVALHGEPEVARYLGAEYGAQFEPSVLGDVVPDATFVTPLIDVGTGRQLGVLGFGVNPYRALDDSHREFLDLVAYQVSRICSQALSHGSQSGQVEQLSSALSKARDHASNLERALATNREIGTAIGILMHRFRITQPEAFQLLRDSSQRLNLRLQAVADRVVLTGELPDHP
jgi:hypothetical protein